MKDYVFYPIALSKSMGRLGRKARKSFGNNIGKQVPAAISSTIVFILVGAWHGSSLKFVAYGLYNGVFVLSEPLFSNGYTKIRSLFDIESSDKSTFIVFQIVRTIFIITIGRVFSRQKTLMRSVMMIKLMFSNWNPWVLFDGSIYNLGLDRSEFKVLIFALLILFIVSLAQENGLEIRVWLSNQPYIFRYGIIIIFIVFILVFGFYGPDINASDFIYGGF